MQYDMTARLYWTVFKGGFERELKNTLGISDTKTVMKKAHKKYREMLESVQPFERRTRFISNITLASMLGGIYLSLDKKPDIEKMTAFNREALMNNRVMLKAIVSERNYTAKGQEKLRQEAEISLTDSNAYSWQYTFEAGTNLMEYTATFRTSELFCLNSLPRIYGYKEFVS